MMTDPSGLFVVIVIVLVIIIISVSGCRTETNRVNVLQEFINFGCSCDEINLFLNALTQAFDVFAQMHAETLDNHCPGGNTMNELNAKLEAQGIQQVGQHVVGLVGAGKTLPACIQDVITYIERNSSLPGDHDHNPPHDQQGCLGVNRWITAEYKRLQVYKDLVADWKKDANC
jgi:hypothetical protein